MVTSFFVASLMLISGGYCRILLFNSCSSSVPSLEHILPESLGFTLYVHEGLLLYAFLFTLQHLLPPCHRHRRGFVLQFLVFCLLLQVSLLVNQWVFLMCGRSSNKVVKIDLSSVKVKWSRRQRFYRSNTTALQNRHQQQQKKNRKN